MGHTRGAPRVWFIRDDLNRGHGEVGSSVVFNFTEPTTFAGALAAGLADDFLESTNHLLTEAEIELSVTISMDMELSHDCRI